MYYCYLITNKVNGKVYVGKTNYQNPKRRFTAHIKVSRKPEKYKVQYHLLHRAIRKYGEQSFEFAVIESFLDEEESLEAEKY